MIYSSHSRNMQRPALTHARARAATPCGSGEHLCAIACEWVRAVNDQHCYNDISPLFLSADRARQECVRSDTRHTTVCTSSCELVPSDRYSLAERTHTAHRRSAAQRKETQNVKRRTGHSGCASARARVRARQTNRTTETCAMCAHTNTNTSNTCAKDATKRNENTHRKENDEKQKC